MNTRNYPGRRRRRLMPSLERIESRELLSGILAVLPALSGHFTPIHALSGGAAGGGGGAGGAGSGGGLTTPTGQPTPHEAAREAFSARFQGSYTVGPARFSDQKQQVFFVAAGNSSAFRHGNMQMAFFIPTDPTATITGLTYIFVKNYANSGNLLVLDLQADPQSLVNGVPTRFTWTVNGSSGGTFSSATGQGTGQILYTPSGHLPQRATAAGHFGVVFTGMIDTSGVSSPFRF